MLKHYEKGIYSFERFRLDASSAMLYRDDVEISLPPKAIETLLALVERVGEIVPKDELIAVIWTDSIVEESNLFQYLSLLRKTLGYMSDGRPFIQTLRRRGFRFNGRVTTRDAHREANGSANDSRRVIAAPPHSRRIERHGNVLALVDWHESDNNVLPTTEEPVTREAGYLDLRSKRISRWPYVAAAVFGTIILATISIIWLVPPSTRQNSQIRDEFAIKTLTNGEPLDAATISPDGKYFTYSSNDSETSRLWLQQTGEAERREIATIAGSIRETAFTPDSRSVYFIANENPNEPNTLYRVAALGGPRSKILTDIATGVSFSPDGREMVFMRMDQKKGETSLVIAATEGTSQRVLLTRRTPESINGSAAWSSDGSRIAFGAVDLTVASSACSLVGADPRTGETKSLTAEKWDQCYRLAWTHDSKGLVMVGTKSGDSLSTRRDNVYYISLVDGSSRRLTNDGYRYESLSLGVSNADEILAAPFNRLSQIWALSVDGDSRNAMQITKGYADGRSGIAPLADGRIGYITRQGDGISIWIANRDGSNRRQITTDPPEIEEVRAPPDGRFFVFSGRKRGDGSQHLHRVDANGANLAQITFSAGNEIDSTVSPDGNWIVYNSFELVGDYEKYPLWKIPSSGGDPIRLGDANCQTPHFSPDGGRISCVSSDWRKLFVLSAENGEPIKNIQLARMPLLGVGSRWTPDGKELTYILQTKDVSNIWRQPLDGSEPHPLTDFTSGQIYNYAFSIDGAWLYVARGYPTSNAILISNFK